MTWQRILVCSAILIAGLIIYAPYEWGSELLDLEKEVPHLPEDDWLLSRRRTRIISLRQTYPLRTRQFILGGETRIIPAPFSMTIQRRLVIEQLALECLAVLLLACGACVLVSDSKEIKLRTPLESFNGVPYIELVGIAAKKLNLSSHSQLEVMKKVNLVVQAHIKGDTAAYLKLQREIDTWLSHASRINAKLPKTFLKVEADLLTEKPLKLQIENPTLAVEVVGVPLVDVNIKPA